MSVATTPPGGVYAAPVAIVPEWVFRRLEALPSEALRLYVWLGLYVAGAGNRGYKRLEDIAAALGVSESTVKRRLKALKDAGVLAVRRYRRKSGQYGQNVYYLLRDDPDLVPGPDGPAGGQGAGAATGHGPADQGSAGGHGPADQGSAGGQGAGGRGSARGHEHDPQPDMPDFTGGQTGGHTPPAGAVTRVQPQVTTAQPEVTYSDPRPEVTLDDPSINPVIGFTQREILRISPPPRGGGGQAPLFGPIEGEILPPAGEGNAGLITRHWIDYCQANGIKLTLRHIKRYAAGIKTALDQGFSPELIWQALQSMLRDQVIARPALLDNYLVRVQTGPELPPERLTPTAASIVRLNGPGSPAKTTAKDLVLQFVAELEADERREAMQRETDPWKRGVA